MSAFRDHDHSIGDELEVKRIPDGYGDITYLVGLKVRVNSIRGAILSVMVVSSGEYEGFTYDLSYICFE